MVATIVDNIAYETRLEHAVAPTYIGMDRVLATKSPKTRSLGQEGPSAMVARALRQGITRGELSPNERLVEADLASRYGVSRAAVRTALLELDKEGLVEREKSRGARVRSITLAEAIEIAEVRAAVEALCAAKAAKRASPDDIRELRRIITEMKRAHSQVDLLGYSELNRKLHLCIRQISHHSTAATIVEQLRNQSMRQSFRIALLPGRTKVSLREHEAIVTAIAAHDPDVAEVEMRGHLNSVIDALHQLKSASAETVTNRIKPITDDGR